MAAIAAAGIGEVYRACETTLARDVGALDSPAYVLDAVSLGIPKGWIMLGHALSEEQGMLEMAQWLKSSIPEAPVQLVEAGEPFWVPR